MRLRRRVEWLALLAGLVSLPLTAQENPLVQKDIEIDPGGSRIAVTATDGKTGHGDPGKVRHDIKLNNYGICSEGKELSQALFVTASHWVLFEQNAAEGDGGLIKVLADTGEIGDLPTDICLGYGEGSAKCKNAGLPGELDGEAIGKKVFVKYKDGTPSAYVNKKIMLVPKKAANIDVCD